MRMNFTFTASLPVHGKADIKDLIEGLRLYADDLHEARPQSTLRINATVTVADGRQVDLENVVYKESCR